MEELTRCNVIGGKFGPQVVHNGEFYKIGSFSISRVQVGRSYDFILEVKEHQGRTIRWANLPRKKKADDVEDESYPEINHCPEGMKKIPPETKPKKEKKSPLEWAVMNRIADALENIDERLSEMIRVFERGK